MKVKLNEKSRVLQPKGRDFLFLTQNGFEAIVIFSLILIFDQSTKWIAVHAGLNYFCNSRGPFGIGSHFSLISAVVLVFIAILYWREKNLQIGRLLLIILAAGTSNFLDRLFYGCVRDFVNLKIWPAFNIADSIITISVMLLIFRVGRRLY